MSLREIYCWSLSQFWLKDQWIPKGPTKLCPILNKTHATPSVHSATKVAKNQRVVGLFNGWTRMKSCSTRNHDMAKSPIGYVIILKTFGQSAVDWNSDCVSWFLLSWVITLLEHCWFAQVSKYFSPYGFWHPVEQFDRFCHWLNHLGTMDWLYGKSIYFQWQLI